MLRLMRDHATSWLIKIILGAIVIVFVFWGVGSFRDKSVNKIAFVNEESISMDEYREAYNKLIERYKQFGTKLDGDMIKRLEKQALDGLIDQSLMRQEAEKLSFRVSDDELADAIQKMEVFQRDGTFDSSLYTRILNANRLTPERFEVVQKHGMLISKLRSFILNNVKVSDQEAMEWFKWNKASASIDYVVFEPNKYKDTEPSDEDMKAYYDNKKESYKTEPEIKAQFLSFVPESYKSETEVTDDEIQDYYEANPEEFKTEKTVQARHILIKVEKDSAPEVAEEKKQKASEILEMAKGGRDFAELAKEYSEDEGSKVRGGDVGEFDRKRMVKPFSDAAFSMKAGEISDLVKTQFGWHIIRVEKVNEESELSLDEAKEKITKKLTDKKAKDIAYDKAEEFYDSFFEGDNLAEIAKVQHLTITATDSFTQKKGPAKGVKNRRKFASAAFKLEAMGISEIEDLGDGYYIIQTIEKTSEKIAEFEDVKEKVRADLIKEKQDEKAVKDANEFLTALKNGESMDTEIEKTGLTLKSTDFFKRNEAIPEIGYEREIAQAAFKLSDEKKIPEDVIKGRKGYYVIRFKERKNPEPEAFDKEKTTVKEQLLQQKKFKTFDAWLSKVKDGSEITIEADFLN